MFTTLPSTSVFTLCAFINAYLEWHALKTHHLKDFTSPDVAQK